MQSHSINPRSAAVLLHKDMGKDAEDTSGHFHEQPVRVEATTMWRKPHQQASPHGAGFVVVEKPRLPRKPSRRQGGAGPAGHRWQGSIPPWEMSVRTGTRVKSSSTGPPNSTLVVADRLFYCWANLVVSLGLKISSVWWPKIEVGMFLKKDRSGHGRRAKPWLKIKQGVGVEYRKLQG